MSARSLQINHIYIIANPVLERKRRDYAEYRTARADMRQLVMARKNIEILLGCLIVMLAGYSAYQYYDYRMNPGYYAISREKR